MITVNLRSKYVSGQASDSIGCRKASAAGAGAGRKALEVKRHRNSTMEAFALCFLDEKGQRAIR